MNILDTINETKKEEVRKLKRNFTYSRFADSEYFNKKRIPFYDSLNNKEKISIIAEVKKASPSKGIIRRNFNHLEIAKSYMKCNVEAISVLTDKNYFQGNITFLFDIAKHKTVPLLRKDFIINEYQIYEAKANGADAVLLIAESLSKNQISELTDAAIKTDLEVLLELHSINQIEKINFTKNKIIGINNRNLKTFDVNLNTVNEIAQILPKENLIVSESGIKTKEDIEFLKTTRTKAVLVGELFMKSENIKNEVKQFTKWCSYEN
jgi:indole-3-glycerol phosphate synthase